jgi:hypothetical protein
LASKHDAHKKKNGGRVKWLQESIKCTSLLTPSALFNGQPARELHELSVENADFCYSRKVIPFILGLSPECAQINPSYFSSRGQFARLVVRKYVTCKLNVFIKVISLLIP